MQNMIKEFKDFINKGDVVMIAVGLIMALYFKAIVDAVLAGVIDPIIAAIFGKADISGIGFTIGDARFKIGLVISAAIDFLVVGFILFVLVKAYNGWKPPVADESEPGPSEIDLLTDIRDALRSR